jgi:hypothetical protein
MAVKRIVAPGRIPVTCIQEIISAVNKNNRIAILLPPIAIVSLVAITAKCVGKAPVLLIAMPLMPRFAL